MSKVINLFNIPIDAITMQETLEKFELSVLENKQIHHTVVNAGKIVLMQVNEELNNSVLEADIINADGQAVVWAANLLGYNLPERVSGIDLMERLVELSFKRDYKCFFFGATKEIVSKVVDHYENKYSNDIVAGYRDGYFDKSDEKEIVSNISNSGANILFVAMSSPKKEIFLNAYKQQLKSINFIMGVGGSFDVIAGKVKRAPIWMQRIGLEWFYRVVQEPKRMWRRYLVGNSKFIWLVFKEYFNRK
tara:strand:+ start:36 stop:779 length:744 start_codon:yes stop_codon:yes gene_type:complete